jgi:hypothetical protein
MELPSIPSHAVMEGAGAYNQHAKLQASGVSLAARYLEAAAREIITGPADEPLVVADYGSSQGKNSLMPMRLAIGALRSQAGLDRPIFVFHVDQPSNDFNSLFQVLHSDTDSYSANDTNVFPSAIGRSFYERVFPGAYIHLGWSSYAAVWLSRVPAHIPDHCFIPRCTGAERAEFERQAARDWQDFLSLRASELRPGGRLVVALPALNDAGSPGLLELTDQANEVLAEMVHESTISRHEFESMTIGAYLRSQSELLAPFAQGGQFQGLALEAYEVFANPDPAWEDYQEDGDRDALAAKHALFFRSTFLPSLVSALAPARDAEELRAFAGQLEDGMRRRRAERPMAIDIVVQTIVLSKQPQALGSLPYRGSAQKLESPEK